MVTYTSNKGYGYPAHGAEVNNWDAFLNAIFTNVDLNVGGTNTTAASSITTNIALAAGDGGTAQYMHQRITGTLSNNVTLTFPSTDLGGAFGGFWIVSNETTGSFSITALTTSSTNSGVILPSGRTLIVSDGTNVNYGSNTSIAKFYTYLGNPSSAVAGQAGTSNGSVTDAVWDGTNKRLYVPAVTGVSTGTVYIPVAGFPDPGGYLTPVSNTPIITSDQTVSTIYYTPFISNWITLPSSSGTYFYATQFSQLSLSMSALGANNIYDVYVAYLSSVGTFGGFSPSWTAGGGSISAGSGSRGVGAGSAQITRGTNGQYLNTNAMSIVNGPTTYSVSAGAAVMVGSVYTDAAGTLKCHRSFGTNRIWGISNAYNRQATYLKAGPSGSWNTTTAVGWRVANNSTANSMVVFSALPEEVYEFSNNVAFYVQSNPSVAISIGLNSTITPSGTIGAASGMGTGSGPNPPVNFGNAIAKYTVLPSNPGINVLYPLEITQASGQAFFVGGEGYNNLTAQWRA